MAKGDFDKKYNELLSIHDYRGLASLLRNTKYDSQDARNRAFSMAEKYEEEADIADKILGSATETQKAAYNFLAFGPNKPQEGYADVYTKDFADSWNSMADENGVIKFRTITQNGKDLLDYFVDGSGIPLDKFESLGLVRGNDGIISVKTDNPNKMEIYNGLKEMLVGVEKAYIGYNSGYPDYTPHNPGIEEIIPVSWTIKDKTAPHNEFYGGTEHPFNSMSKTIEQANVEYDNLMSEQTPYVLQTMVTGYMGEDDKQLQEAFAQGAMDLQTFKEARAILEEKYNRLLQTSSLTQYQVWTTDEDNNGSQFLVELKDNIEKAAINDEINLAIADGRLHYSHASNGLAYGTMIVIDQKYDNKGNAISEHPARRFFVKDLFKSEAENSLRQDTQTDAQLQYAKHQTYGHTYRAKDGGRLENWDGSSDSAIYIDEFGNERAVSKAEILNIMDDDIITRRMLDYYRKANARNSKGRNYTEEGFQVYGNTGIDSDVLHDNVSKKALAVMSAKYGDPNSDYVKMKANKLTSTIMRILFEEI